MQKQNTMKYVGVKCYNQQLGTKNPVMFQNSLIYHKTKDQISKNHELGPQNYSKALRIHTEGSQPFNQKGKYFFQTNFQKDKRKKQSLRMKPKQEDKKDQQTNFNQLIYSKGASQKQFKYVGNFVNIRKSDSIKKQSNVDFTSFSMKDKKEKQLINNFTDNKFLRCQTSTFMKQKANKNQGFSIQQNIYAKKSKDKQQQANNYAKRCIKTQIDQVFANPTNQIQKKGFNQYFRKSFKTSIRKTQNDDMDFRANQNKFRMTSTFGQCNKNIQNPIILEKKNLFSEDKQNKKQGSSFAQEKSNNECKNQHGQKLFQNTVFLFRQNSENVKKANQNQLLKAQKEHEHNQVQKSQKKMVRSNTQQNVKQRKNFFLKERNSRQQQKPLVQFQQKPKFQTDWKRDLILLQKIGEGTFGKVYKAKLKSNSANLYAVKRVFIDKKYKSRQLQIVKQLNNPTVMKVHKVFTTNQGNDQYLNIIMDYYDKNLYQAINENNKNIKAMSSSVNSLQMSQLQQKILIYQIFKGLSYIHSLKICHRDIKPHNMLVNGWKLVLCDFGSAKKLISQQSNLSYICSRCYRAPELIFGSTNYTTQIDVWSAACVILQILNKIPLFIGQNSLDHFLQVIKVIGTPTKAQVLAMNPNYDITEFDLPLIKRKSLTKLFPKADNLLIDLLNKLLIYNPNQRLTAIQTLCHPYFDEIRKQQTYFKIESNMQKQDLNSLFEFSDEQISLYRLKSRQVDAKSTQKQKQSRNLVSKDKQIKSTRIHSRSQVHRNLQPEWIIKR